MATDRSLLDFVELLSQRQQNLLANLPAASQLAAQLSAMTPSLFLARAALEKQALLAKHPDLPVQIAVVGPTQAGKSSLVNLILGQAAAGVSPLAGFTVHPQAFLHGLKASNTGWLEEFFAGFKRLRCADPSRDRDEAESGAYDCFGVAEVEARSDLRPCVIWDTPDFDSLRARQYLKGVLRTAALADLLVVVVSKDKYADQAVWDFLALLEGLSQPTLVCINKIRPGTQETLFKSWEEKWRKVRQDLCPKLVALEYFEHPEVGAKNFSPLPIELLDSALDTALRERHRQARRTRALVRRHWSEWTAPIRAELEAEQRFQAMVEAALEQALAIYRHDYLDHPVGYATFQRALTELLTLLEIPGLARPMIAFRKAITWPIKALFKRQKSQSTDHVQELLILRRSVEHVLLQLMASLREQTHNQNHLTCWWQEIERRYQAAYPNLLKFFESQAAAYYQAFGPQVEEAARNLYRRLQEMPATLNSLRAARASADAAGLALLFQTGGIGPHDFVLAPAMLSLTSLLAESALGRYMEIVAADLKRTQLKAVKTLLMRLGKEISAIVDQMDESVCFRIQKDTLTQVETQLSEPSYGLKLFPSEALRT